MAAGSRAAEYGRIPLVEHMAQSNRESILACMIEDMEAVERIDEIAAVEGVDLLAVGPSDLSRSLKTNGSRLNDWEQTTISTLSGMQGKTPLLSQESSRTLPGTSRWNKG